MNNPFTSQRTLLTNIQKTKPAPNNPNNPTQQASSLPTNRNKSPIKSQPTENTNFNINTNSGVNANIGGNSYTNFNSISNSISNSNSNSNGYRNVNINNSGNSGNVRVGFNRGGEDGGAQGNVGGYSVGVNNKQEQIKDHKIDLNFRSQFRQPQENNLNSHSKPPQNPTYTQYQASSITSSIPSMTIPASTQKISSGYQSVNKQQQIQSQVKNSYQPPQTYSYQGSQSNQGGFQGSRGDSFGAGVEKQKITFGVGSATGGDTKIQYDRAKFINREELVSSGSSHNYPAQNPSSGTKQMASITMSPIQQHSKHKFDDNSQEFLDLDAMGDDIDKILASSKNQEELCRLLGIEGSGSNIPNNNSWQAMSQQNAPYSRELSNDIPKKTQDTNFVKKTSLPNSHDPYSHLIYQNTKQRERDIDQVFNYQAPTEPQQPPYKPTNPQNINPNRITSTSTSIKNQQSLQNPDPIMTNVTQNEEIHVQTNVYASELQQAINLEMKKLSYVNVNKGKVRVFLSASERIETVKCHMEFI